MDELRSECNLWNEQNNGLVFLESLLGQLDIDISFARSRNAMQKNSAGVASLNILDSLPLGGVERIVVVFRDFGEFFDFVTAFFSNTAWQGGLDNTGHRCAVIVREPSESLGELER